MAAFPEVMDFAADREQSLRAVAELARRAREAVGCDRISSSTTWCWS